jgi:hypothetical protein
MTPEEMNTYAAEKILGWTRAEHQEGCCNYPEYIDGWYKYWNDDPLEHILQIEVSKWEPCWINEQADRVLQRLYDRWNIYLQREDDVWTAYAHVKPGKHDNDFVLAELSTNFESEAQCKVALAIEIHKTEEGLRA